MWLFWLGCVVGTTVGTITMAALVAGKTADLQSKYALLVECHDDYYQGMLIALERVGELEEAIKPFAQAAKFVPQDDRPFISR